jgi:hypothetical protein
MFSRLSAFAAIFAVVTTASLAVAATVKQQQIAAASAPLEVIQLERVMVIGKRVPVSN